MLFDYPFCISHCNIYLEKDRNHDKFKVVVIALLQIQNGSGGSHADASPKFKMAHVAGSVEFKMSVIVCTDTRWQPCVCSWCCFDIQFKMARLR